MSDVDIRLLLLEQYEQALNRAWQKRDVDAALGAAQALAQVRQQALGAEHPEVANALGEVVEALRLKRDFSGAARAAEQVVAIERAAYGDAHERYGEALHRLGHVLLEQGALTEAQQALAEAAGVLERALGDSDARVGIALGAWAGAAGLSGDACAASALSRKAVTVFERTQSPALPEALLQLAQAAARAGQLDDAEDAARRALRLHPSPGKERAHAHEVVGEVLELRGRLVEAREQYRLALALFGETLPPRHPQLGVAAMNVATLELQLGEVGRAAELSEQSLRVFVDAFGPTHAHTQAMCHALERLFSSNGYADQWHALSAVIPTRA